MDVTHFDDPLFIGTEAKKMARYLLRKNWNGPGDTLEAACYRVQENHNVQASIIKQGWNREPRDMKATRFMPLFVAYFIEKYRNARQEADATYEKDRDAAEMEGVDPFILWLADCVAGEMVAPDHAPKDDE